MHQARINQPHVKFLLGAYLFCIGGIVAPSKGINRKICAGHERHRSYAFRIGQLNLD